jgi:hypothetical protein
LWLSGVVAILAVNGVNGKQMVLPALLTLREKASPLRLRPIVTALPD